ncbi:pyruvate dehydrogenase (acetyl-transferring) E1 component subunit alpha [Pacificimonas sp. WHA3]|uniref:Pyruvate dehydrogenase E1 component subunit alpha n=1 Tax=Pacificimonas pallii TaxID=2827236 RepID=A0ABS6SDP0_9SPHN|nr:pyruvate dehydrogenase (acetyl-transferring) E1 component subunit alpha [Pacificimonas pallii]MBV7256537.1 pyruvate dehydrogenase (acetyl-transferring) E1 component subunit alpha [Pacificimonas pallii]
MAPKKAARKQTKTEPSRVRVSEARPGLDPIEAPGRYEATREELTEFYRQMLLIRRFEEKAGQLYGMGLIGGFCHLYIGQEAVVVGLQSAMKEQDSVITGYRDHGHMLACGIPAKVVMAELTGRAAGISKGKGGSMHMFSVEHGFYGGHGIVAAQVPLGTGLAFAHKYKGDDGVATTYFGDGAANQGQVYESFNMAELWKLPVLYVIENNQYAMGTSVNRASAEHELFRRGESFRIEGMQVNGMDVLDVRGAGDAAYDWIRSGKGPLLIEMMTYRYRGHSMSDPAKYRSRDEVTDVRTKRDPIEAAKVLLLEMGETEDGLKELEKIIRAEVNEAADFAEQTPEPELKELYTDVLVGSYG